LAALASLLLVLLLWMIIEGLLAVRRLQHEVDDDAGHRYI